MTLYHEIEAECERLADCPDTAENARLGITFRAVWWRQIQQEISSQADKIERLRKALKNVRPYIANCDHEPALDEIDAALKE